MEAGIYRAASRAEHHPVAQQRHPPREKYIENAVACLRDSAASIRIVRPFGLPNGAKGRDICDWNGSADELDELIERADIYEPINVSIDNKPSKFRLIAFEDIRFDVMQ